jgi:hypothetical protein
MGLALTLFTRRSLGPHGHQFGVDLKRMREQFASESHDVPPPLSSITLIYQNIKTGGV